MLSERCVVPERRPRPHSQDVSLEDAASDATAVLGCPRHNQRSALALMRQLLFASEVIPSPGLSPD